MPVRLWNAIWIDTPLEPLKYVALHALPNDPSEGTRDLLLAVLQDVNAGTTAKQAVLTGLGKASPPYATQVLLLSMSSWESNIDLAGHGLRALALQADNAARTAVYTLASDSNKPEALRISAIVA